MRGLLVVLAVAVLSCAAPTTIPPAAEPKAARDAEAKKDPDALPKVLEDLELSDAQRKKIKALFAKLKDELAPATAQRDQFRAAMISATARCEADDSTLHIQASRMVEAGNAERDHVLDAANGFHAILTAKQRAKLVDPLLNGDRPIAQDTTDAREQGMGEIAEALDLGFLQKVELVKRALSRLSVTTSETNALRDQAIVALTAFKGDDFDIRDHTIAQAPVVELYTRFVLDLAQIILPVLDEDQCRTAAGLLRRAFKRRDQPRK